MRKNQLIIALIIFVALTIFSFISSGKKQVANISPGDAVFKPIQEENYEKIIIKSTATKVESELIFQKNRWIVKNRFEMECDPAIMRKLFAALKETKTIHLVNHRPEDLNLFYLNEENTIKLELYEKGSAKPLVYHLGKNHSFKPEYTGRYIFLPEKNAVVLTDSSLSFIAGAPNIWLKKFLPHHEQVAGISLYMGDNILWKSERASGQQNFSLVLPKNNNASPQTINQLMTYAMQMRFLDITPATNTFKVDSELKDTALYFNTFTGRTYKLTFLKKENDMLRCAIQLIYSKVKNEFKKDYGDDEVLRDELVDWHFLIPYKIYEELYRL